MNIGDIEKLPDRLPTEVLLSLFRNVLKDFKNKILDKSFSVHPIRINRSTDHDL